MFHEDPDLEALFPTSVGGQPITVQSMHGQAIDDGADEAFVTELEAMLAEQGRTLDDVSVAFGSAGQDAIIAVRVAGGDPSASATLLIEGLSGLEGIEPVPGQVAGKDVLIATAGEQTWYVYPQGEIVWVVAAGEPALTEDPHRAALSPSGFLGRAEACSRRWPLGVARAGRYAPTGGRAGHRANSIA